MATIFISYRRADSADISGRIYDRLTERFGREHVFKDVDSIPPGVNFPDYIAESIQASNVVLVVIGPQWLNASSGFAQRRLDDPADFVRVEIETALRLGIAVIPVLVGGARMPAERRLPASLRLLLQQNGVNVRRDPDFSHDMDRVFAAIDYWQGRPRRAPAPQLAFAPEAPTAPSAPLVTTLGARVLTESPALTPRHTPTLPNAIAEDGKTGAYRHMLRRTPFLALGSALALVALVGSVMLSPPLQRLLRLSAPNTQATQMALQHNMASTETAQANAGAYVPRKGIGPCADPSETTGDGISTYWQTIGLKLTSCDSSGKVATLKQSINGGGAATVFRGAAGTYSGYPQKFTASYTIVFHDGSTPACAELSATYAYDLSGAPTSPAAGRDFRICSTGSWTDTISKQAGTYPIQNATALVAIAVSAAGVRFSVNGSVLEPGPTMGSTHPFDSLGIAASSSHVGTIEGTLGSIAVSDFKIVPNTP